MGIMRKSGKVRYYPKEADLSRGTLIGGGTGLCIKLAVNFREFAFHALR
jgi:hypothetical protein